MQMGHRENASRIRREKRQQNASIENDGFVPINQDTVFQMPADSPSEHDFFKVASFPGQIVGLIPM